MVGHILQKVSAWVYTVQRQYQMKLDIKLNYVDSHLIKTVLGLAASIATG